MGCSPWSHKESDMTERLSFSYIYVYIYTHKLKAQSSTKIVQLVNMEAGFRTDRCDSRGCAFSETIGIGSDPGKPTAQWWGPFRDS